MKRDDGEGKNEIKYGKAMRFSLRIVVVRSLMFVWWRNFRYKGFQFANKELCGWRSRR